MHLTPNKTDFQRLAETHSLIPVFADLSVDLETPVSLYFKIVGDAPGFMLESAETSKNFGRYSFIGVEPFLVIEAYKEGLNLNYVAKSLFSFLQHCFIIVMYHVLWQISDRNIFGDRIFSTCGLLNSS